MPISGTVILNNQKHSGPTPKKPFVVLLDMVVVPVIDSKDK